MLVMLSMEARIDRYSIRVLYLFFMPARLPCSILLITKLLMSSTLLTLHVMIMITDGDSSRGSILTPDSKCIWIFYCFILVLVRVSGA
jgi:hypothetical protein